MRHRAHLGRVLGGRRVVRLGSPGSLGVSPSHVSFPGASLPFHKPRLLRLSQLPLALMPALSSRSRHIGLCASSNPGEGRGVRMDSLDSPRSRSQTSQTRVYLCFDEWLNAAPRGMRCASGIPTCVPFYYTTNGRTPPIPHPSPQHQKRAVWNCR